jgi:hypothetical protein
MNLRRETVYPGIRPKGVGTERSEREDDWRTIRQPQDLASEAY